MKKIIAGILLVLMIVILFLCTSNYSKNFSGIIIENGKENNVNIIVKNRRINKLMNRMVGNIYIQLEDNNNSYEYNFLGPVFNAEDCYFVSVIRFDEIRNQFDNGYMYFDKDLKNIVLIDTERQIYAAGDEFITIVKYMNNVTVEEKN